MLPTVEESRGYDFQDPENAEKWRGMFVNSLRKVLEQVHPTLTAEQSALQYVESLCLRLLAMLCAQPSPLTVQDVEERVARLFPTPLDKWALADARLAVAKSRRRLLLNHDKVHHMLQKEVLLYKIDVSVSIFMTAILEYVSADILKLAGNFVKKISQKSGYETVTSRDIKTAMCADKVLQDMFYCEWEVPSEVGDRLVECLGGSVSYQDLVRDLLADENTFLRDLHLIIRVFRDELDKIQHDPKTISLIFGNIMDIYELTVTLLGNLEDASEVAQDSNTPYIGSCFEELAEVEEFRAYIRYANIVTSKESRDALQAIVDDPVLSERLETGGHGFRLCVKYYLPRLLLAPLGHVLLYHSYVLTLLQIAPHNDDRESFKQVECNLQQISKNIQKALGNGPKIDATLRMASRARRQLAIEKCNELSRLIDNWDTKDIGQCCNEFIREDTLSKIGPGKRIAERRAYLFDGLLLLCKPITSLVGVNAAIGSGSGVQQLKLKERLYIRKLDIIDRNDTEEGRHMFELHPRVGPNVILSCACLAEKRAWMADLVMLNTKPMLVRSLDSILLDLERRHPLKLPPVHLYRFAVPDSPDNIVLEDRNTQPVPLIKGATLLKLVERLTYHIYADLSLVRTFLTTYRSFCSPRELLDLLIERFNIPEPSQVYDAPKGDENTEPAISTDAEKLSKNTAREDWKRYRKEFQQPVKFRVINVLRHWVDQHFYDFERDPELLEKLKQFLESVDGKPMRKWVQSVLKTVQRKSFGNIEGVCHVFSLSPPLPTPHLANPVLYNWCPLALHPRELARQLTKLHHTMYSKVKPSELVGAVWTKKDKEKTSPNLLALIKHTTNLTRWVEKWIVESCNTCERVAVFSRLIEVALCLHHLNNFNGVLAVSAAYASAHVHRLKATIQLVPVRLQRALEQFLSLHRDHFKLYQERLRSINPPCVPFFGMYLTNILHIEEGNLDYLPNSELINFSKRRKVAEITGEIQQYQNQPYCLTVEPQTMAFLESLDPFPGMDDNEITNYLYTKSLEIEPRNMKQIPKFPRKYPELSLKLVKVSRRDQDDKNSMSNNNDDTISVSQLSPTGSSWDGQSVASLPVHSDHRGSMCEVTSPRQERSSTAFSLFDKKLTLFDKTRSTSTLNAKCSNEPPSPRDRHSPRHDRVERKALSPRAPTVDADLFYNRNENHNSILPQEREREKTPEAVPPLLPRTISAPKPPATPSREAISSEPPEPPDRPLPSPKHHELFRTPVPGVSPKRSPALIPTQSPLNSSERLLFSFPLAGSPSPPAPLTPHHTNINTATHQTTPPSLPTTTTTQHNTIPPPLPPRKRRDSITTNTLPHTPRNCGGGSNCDSGNAPPALPPRPLAAPALLRPHHSAILQRRRHTTSSTAPRLPPKPPPLRP